MSAGAAVRRATAEVALRVGVECGVPASRFLALRALARKKGYRDELEALGAILVAAAGGDDVENALLRESPRAERDRVAHLRAEVRGRCGRGGDWAAQTRREKRRGGRNGREGWAVSAARDAAHELFPGCGGAAERKRRRWLRSIGAIAPKASAQGGAA